MCWDQSDPIPPDVPPCWFHQEPDCCAAVLVATGMPDNVPARSCNVVAMPPGGFWPVVEVADDAVSGCWIKLGLFVADPLPPVSAAGVIAVVPELDVSDVPVTIDELAA